MPASVVLTEPVAGPTAMSRITEAGNRAIRLQGHFENAAQKNLCSSVTLIIVSLWLLPCDD
jgi:hypothetical protein